MADLIVGADVGGSTTRVVVAGLDGQVHAYAGAAGGNPNAVGLDLSAQRIRDATTRCLVQTSGTVRAMVVGLAGGSRVGADAGFLEAITPDRVVVAPKVVSDLTVAFASASPQPTGCVLVAGTGAVAGRIVDEELTDRRDGWGWLVGDEGSGFWLGRETVRATLRVLQSGRPPGPLHRAVLEAAGAGDASQLLQRCYAEPPIWLGTLGSLVTQFRNDSEANQIADRAAGHLVGLLESLGAQPSEPIVLGGSVLTSPGPVADEVRDRLADWPHPVLATSTGLVGALWIAARSIGVTDSAVHDRMIITLGRLSV